MQPERLSGFYKKEITGIAAVMAAFLFLENKSDKSQGLGQSPKVLTGNLQCSLIRECHCRKVLETTIYDIIDFFVRECIKQEVRFRVCKHCNQFFALTGHINTEYCDRPFDSAGRTCKEMGALRLWEKKKANTPALKAYSKAYKKRFAWIKYGKITKEAFYKWAEKAREKRELCLKGRMTLEEFKAWLDD